MSYDGNFESHLRPSQVFLADEHEFVNDVLTAIEDRVSAARYVRVCRSRGDRWQAVTFSDLVESLVEDIDAYTRAEKEFRVEMSAYQGRRKRFKRWAVLWNVLTLGIYGEFAKPPEKPQAPTTPFILGEEAHLRAGVNRLVKKRYLRVTSSGGTTRFCAEPSLLAIARPIPLRRERRGKRTRVRW